jgi:hypothetical protein
MTRRNAILIGAVSLIVASGIGAFVVGSPSAPRVGTLGTITTPTTTQPTSAIRERNVAPASIPPTYPTATTVPPALPPTTIRIPAIGLDASIIPVGLVPGTSSMQIPDIDHVGWYRLGPGPGQTGSAVLVGHVDGGGRPGVFWRLGKLETGDNITIAYNGTKPLRFRVTGRQQVAKDELPAALFSRAGPPRIALITCGGAFNTATRHYDDNVVIVATPA